MTFTPSKDFRRPSIPKRNNHMTSILRLQDRRNGLPLFSRSEPLENLVIRLLFKRRAAFDAAIAPPPIRVNAPNLLRNLFMRHILKRDLVATREAVSKTGVIYDLVHRSILRPRNLFCPERIVHLALPVAARELYPTTSKCRELSRDGNSGPLQRSLHQTASVAPNPQTRDCTQLASLRFNNRELLLLFHVLPFPNLNAPRSAAPSSPRSLRSKLVRQLRDALRGSRARFRQSSEP